MNNVLIINNGSSFSTEATAALEQADLRVTLIPNYHEALRELARNGFDLIILEDGMAEMEIGDTCARLRQISEAPIILVNGDSNKQAWVRAIEAGADFYMTEPFSIPELVARAGALLRRRKSAHQLCKAT